MSEIDTVPNGEGLQAPVDNICGASLPEAFRPIAEYIRRLFQ